MSKQVFPAVPGYNGQVYSDDSGSPRQLNLDHLAESFQLSDLLERLGHTDASELARPVHLIGGFKPAGMIEKLHEYARQCSGPACIACVNAERLPEFIWSYNCTNGVNDLVRLRLAGGHVLGLLCFPADGEVAVYPESGPDEPLSLVILNVFARGFRRNPQYLSANELLETTKPISFEPNDIEKTLDRWSDWSAKNPIDIHQEISTETVQEGKANVRHSSNI